MGNKNNIKVSKVKVIALIIVVVFLIFIICALFNNNNNPLVGKWENEKKDTIYQFEKDNTGKLIVRNGEYNFDYEIKDDKVSVYFKSDASTDTVFDYEVKDNKLVLKNSNANVTFTRID